MGSPLIVNQKDHLHELLDSAPSVGIVIGDNQNIDTVAASLGLYLVLQAQEKNIQVVSRKEPIVEFSNLVGIDRISQSFQGSTKALTISVPYREGEIEKVSYNIEDDRLNVNLFAQGNGITFNEREIEYIRKGSAPSLVILFGVSNESELNGLVDLKTVKTIAIDNNPLNSVLSDISIIDLSFSSVSEIVAGIIMELALPYDIDAFQNLMDGIIFATRNFTRQDSSPFVFEAAGFLLQNGAKRESRSHTNRGRNDNRFPNPRGPVSQKAQVSTPQPGEPVQDQAKKLEEVEAVESSATGEIPDDWFLPKVFKGSKKGN